MAAKEIKGTVTGTYASSYEIKLVLSSTVIDGKLQSTVNASLQFRRTGDLSYPSYNLSDAESSITIDGEKTNKITSYDTRNNKNWIVLQTKTKTVNHNSDGTKSINVSAKFTSNAAAGMTGGNVSGTFKLDNITTSSKILNINSDYIENKISLEIDNDNLYNTLEIFSDTTLIKKVVDYKSLEEIRLTDEEILKSYNCTENLSLELQYKLKTFLDSNHNTFLGEDNLSKNINFGGTSYQNINGVWKRGIEYQNINGIWKKTLEYQNVNKIWKRGI